MQTESRHITERHVTPGIYLIRLTKLLLTSQEAVLVISCCDYVDFISRYIVLKSHFFCARYRKTAALLLSCHEERSIGDEMIQVYLPEGAAQEEPLVFHYQKGPRKSSTFRFRKSSTFGIVSCAWQ